MGVDEIRYWLTVLNRDHGWQMRALGRTMGLRGDGHGWVRKAAGKEWIYRGEQKRMSRQLERILSGELICIAGQGGVKGGTRRRAKVLIAEHPVPLCPPNHWIYDRRLGRLRLVPRDRAEPMRVPRGDPP